MSMKPEFFCCIGAELKDEIAGSLKSSRIFMYRAAESQTIADMLVDGFFNEADDLRLNDLILLYCPEQTRAITYAKVSSVSGGIIKTSSVSVSPEDIPIDTTGYSNISGSNLQQIINSIDAEFNKYLKLDGSSTMTGVLKMRASVSFECALAPYWHGVGFYKLNDDDSVTLMASMEATDGFEPGTNNTYNIGSTSKKWKNLYLVGKAYIATINNGGDIDVPTKAGTMALESDIGRTNCITEIPQDIKLELNNGTLTLKAGSKVYVPNGTGVFDTITIANDLTVTDTQTRKLFIGVNTAGTTLLKCVGSETGTPVAGTYKYYYDDTANKCYQSAAGSTPQVSFPIAIVSATSADGIVSIDQVFNGFGYIGCSTFVLSGVKALIPNGRNADGTLKNTVLNFTTPKVRSLDYATESSVLCFLASSGIVGYGVNKYFEQEEEPSGFGAYATWLNTKENIMYYTTDSGASWTKRSDVYLGKMPKVHNANITSLETKTAFHAVDYNDTEFIGHQAMPSDSYLDLSSGITSGQSFTAPADGYVFMNTTSTAANQRILLTSLNNVFADSSWSSDSNQPLKAILPIRKGDTYTVTFTATNDVILRFYYAQGSK